jgi:hypothetical protein
MTLLKGGVDGFSYFHWFSVILFSIQNHPWVMNEFFYVMYNRINVAYEILLELYGYKYL